MTTTVLPSIGWRLFTKFFRILWLFSIVVLHGSFAEVGAAVSFRVVHTFGSAEDEGENPLGGLTLGRDAFLYGTTQNGGRPGFGAGQGFGTVFRMTVDGEVETLHAFRGSDGAFPAAAPTFDGNGNLWGSTLNDGKTGLGTLFRIQSNGAFTSMYTFKGPGDGGNPRGLTLGRDGNIYGTCYPQFGTIFAITPAGNFLPLYSFTGGADSANPNELTLGADGNFYGVTSARNTARGPAPGTVFRVSPNGAFKTLYTFTGLKDGSFPRGRLVQGSDGSFFGTTVSGGGNTPTNGFGTVFKITPSGALTTLYAFTGGTDGAFPLVGLARGSDNNFYGVTYGGGSDFADKGKGTIFSITPSGIFTSLYTFTGKADAAHPDSPLCLGPNGRLYGTTQDGENGLDDDGSGIAFEVSVTGPPPGRAPAITTQPRDQTVAVAGSAAFSVVASGTAPLTYQWQKDGANLAGATSANLTLNNVRTNQAGNYLVVVRNSLGAATSQVARLVVLVPPSITAQPQSLAVLIGTNVSLNVSAVGSAPLVYQWRKNGVNIAGATNSAHSITGVQTNHSGSYTVVISNAVGSVTSSTAVLTVTRPRALPPAITVQPQSQIVSAGSAATFSVAAAGTGPFTYQWRKNAVNVVGATNATYGITNVQPSHAGKYSVAVSNTVGLVVSAEATLTIAPRTSVRGDFDGDGEADLVLQDDGGSLAVWFMKGATLKSGAYLNPTNVGDRQWRVAASADFNADSKEDLLFQHADGTLATWFMNGVNQTSASLLNPRNPGDANWRAISAADLNKDGKPDLIFQHPNGTLSVWFMSGTNLVSATLMNPSRAGTGWSAIGAADFNADGALDLVFQHADRSLAVWMLDGTSLSQATLVSPSNPGAAWRLASSADRDQDGKPDLLLQHTNGNLAIWFMDGAKLRSAQLLNPANPGGTWKVVAPK